MWIRFTKMHGLGNDFMVIDGVTQAIKLSPQKIRRLGDRNFGVGFDQLLLVEPPNSPDVDFQYRIFNSDGSEVSQCGNGARCFARFVRDRKLIDSNRVRVQTRMGKMEIVATENGDYRVNMGTPEWLPSKIPLQTREKQPVYQLSHHHQTVEFSAVSMGNPHAVILVDSVDDAPVQTLGAELRTHKMFPEGANIGFMQVVSRDEINLRVNERGVSETLACGSGACAAAVIGINRGLLNEKVLVNLKGGSLVIEWSGGAAPVFMTGPAKNVFHGQVRI